MKPHDYQTRGVDFALNTPNKGCYWMIDMGLGKTLMSILLQNRINEPVLVVAPLRPLYSTWTDEIKKWMPDKTVTILHGANKDIALATPSDFYLINPEGFKWLWSIAEKRGLPFKHLIVDEGSCWKSHSTKRFGILRKMLPKFHHKIILSGTPSPQGLMDLWSQYYILDGGERLGRNITQFRNQYFNSIMVGGMYPKFEPKPDALERALERVKDITFRLDGEDYIELPPITYNNIHLNLPPILRKKYRQLERDFLLEIGGGQVEAFNAASLSSKLRQFIQGGLYEGEGKDRVTHYVHSIKLDALKELVEETNQPILCAIQFKFELEQIREAFPDAPYIGGGTSADGGEAIIRQWNEGKIPLLLCHPKSLSHGANLQTGGHIILWYAMPWSAEQYQQLVARLYRQGQKKGVVVHHFVVQDTVDDKVAGALRNKLNVQQTVLDYFKEKADGS